MKKTIILTAAFVLCAMAAVAQNDADAQIKEKIAYATQLYEAGNHQQALDEFLAVARTTQSQSSETERMAYVASQTMAAKCHQALKQYDEAFRLCEALLQGTLTEQERAEVQQLYVNNGYHVGSSYIFKKRFADGQSLLEKILPLADEKAKKVIEKSISMSYYFEGSEHGVEKQYPEALDCMRKAREGFHSINDTANEFDALRNIGFFYEQLFQIKDALINYKQAEALARAIHDDMRLFRILKNEYSLYNDLEDNEQKRRITSCLDSLAEIIDNPEAKFEYYNQKGDEARIQKNYRLAEQWYRKNEAYVNQLGNDYFNKNASNRYVYYTKLGVLFTAERKWDEAEKYTLLCTDEIKKQNQAYGRNDFINRYNSFAMLYFQMNDSVKCFNYLDSLFSQTVEPRLQVEMYQTRGMSYAHFKNYAQASDDYRKADEILLANYGESSPKRLSILSLLAASEHHLGHFDEVVRLYRMYADGVKKTYGENGYLYATALRYLANAEAFANDIDTATIIYIRASDILKGQVSKNIPYLTSAEREGYWNSVYELFNNMTPFAIRAEEAQSSFTSACYDGAVLLKAFLLESERSLYELVKSNGTEKDMEDYLAILSMQAQIKGLERQDNTYSDSILSLTTRIEQLESALASRCRGYGDAVSFMDLGYKQIKEHLGEKEALIDFADFISISDSRGRVYAAYFVNRKQEFPLLQEMFSESRFDSLNIEYPDQYYQPANAEVLYRLLWQPFKELVAEGSTVYYVPTQRLHQIALESLPLPDGSLLGDHYRFVRLSSARELLRMKSSMDFNGQSATPCVALYGGLTYDMDGDELMAESDKYKLSSSLALRGDIACADSLFAPLPGTRHEVDEIERIVKTHHLTATSYTGKQGTEASFVSLSGHSPQILHLATHGFYCTPAQADLSDYLRGYRDAMSLSGLVLSGANAAWGGQELPQGVPDGILTSDNIARLDLGGTELVVLSACQTGRGQATSEGLYGLQRAFKKAGVQTLVLSLWNISDKVASQFMAAFYQSLLDPQTRGDKRRAFNQAKAAIRAQYPDPFYWASFIMLD